MMLGAETHLPVEFSPSAARESSTSCADSDDGFGLSVQKPSPFVTPSSRAGLLKDSARKVMMVNRVAAALASPEDLNEAAHSAMRRAAAANRDSALSYDSNSWFGTLTHIRFGVNRFVAVPWAVVTGCCVLIELLSLLDPTMRIHAPVTVALGGLMSLLLAFRLNSSFNRWWEARSPTRCVLPPDAL